MARQPDQLLRPCISAILVNNQATEDGTLPQWHKSARSLVEKKRPFAINGRQLAVLHSSLYS